MQLKFYLQTVDFFQDLHARNTGETIWEIYEFIYVQIKPPQHIHSRYLGDLKSSLAAGEVTVIFDFEENFTFVL